MVVEPVGDGLCLQMIMNDDDDGNDDDDDNDDDDNLHLCIELVGQIVNGGPTWVRIKSKSDVQRFSLLLKYMKVQCDSKDCHCKVQEVWRPLKGHFGYIGVIQKYFLLNPSLKNAMKFVI